MKNVIDVNRNVIRIANEYGTIEIKNKTAWLAEIEKLFVDEKHRRNGVGRKLLRDAEIEARKWDIGKLSLMCKTNNVSALNLYLKENYRIEGLLKSHFENGIDMYILSKYVEKNE